MFAAVPRTHKRTSKQTCLRGEKQTKQTVFALFVTTSGISVLLNVFIVFFARRLNVVSRHSLRFIFQHAAQAQRSEPRTKNQTGIAAVRCIAGAVGLAAMGGTLWIGLHPAPYGAAIWIVVFLFVLAMEMILRKIRHEIVASLEQAQVPLPLSSRRSPSKSKKRSKDAAEWSSPRYEAPAVSGIVAITFPVST